MAKKVNLNEGNTNSNNPKDPNIDENEVNEESKERKNKIYLWVHRFAILICAVSIAIQIFSWVFSYFAQISTLNVLGNKFYITTYADGGFGFEKGDLIIGKSFTSKDKYYNHDKVIFKTSFKKKESIIVENAFYTVLEKAETNIESKDVAKIKHLGTFLLLLREIFAIIISIVLLIAICIAVHLLRDKNLEKKYLQTRKIKDIIVVTALVVTYISTFFIGKIKTYSNLYDALNEEGIPLNEEIKFEVTEDGTSWDQIKNLNIFENEYFKRKTKVAPGFRGIYEFKVHNKDLYDIFYNINFKETNPENVNLKYKIIKNGVYLNDEYQSIEELNVKNSYLKVQGEDVYQIDWKWIDAPNDTEIGRNAQNVVYRIDISVIAERI